MKAFYVVAYDIADPHRLQRVARVMEDYGVRQQKSVFECWLTETEWRRLRDRLAELTEPTVDSVRCYRLCAVCRQWAGLQPLAPCPPAYWLAEDGGRLPMNMAAC